MFLRIYREWGYLMLSKTDLYLFKQYQKKQVPAKTTNFGKKVTQGPKNSVIAIAEKLAKKHVAIGSTFVTDSITQGRLEQWCADAVNYFYKSAYKKDVFGTNKKGKYINS